MKRKLIIYSFLPVLGLGIAGASVVSAHGFGGFGFGGGVNLAPGDIAARQQEAFQTMANVLGLGVDEVKAAWAEGKTTADLIKEKGINMADVQTRMKEAHLTELKSQLQSLVQNGVITQAQADSRFQVMQNRLANGKVRMGKFHRGFMF